MKLGYGMMALTGKESYEKAFILMYTKHNMLNHKLSYFIFKYMFVCLSIVFPLQEIAHKIS